MFAMFTIALFRNVIHLNTCVNETEESTFALWELILRNLHLAER